MPVHYSDVVKVVLICQKHRQRVRYGVLSAAISSRAGDRNALPRNYARATSPLLNRGFGGPGPAPSWVVNRTGYPTGYGTPLNELYDPNWNINTPLHDSVQGFLDWLDSKESGWDKDLKSTYP